MNITASCVWHTVQTKRVKDEQTLRSKSGLPIGVTGLDYRGSLCGLRAKVTLPKQARSKWGAFAALRGGPVAGDRLQGSTNPVVPMSTSSCQISKGFSTSCSMRLAPPQGLNLDPSFIGNSLTVDFFTTEGKNIKNWINEQRLPAGSSYDIRTEYTYTKCGVSNKAEDQPYNWGLPASTFNGYLGTVGYNLFENYDRGWMAMSFKVMEVTNSTEVKWTFDVPKTTSSKIPKQPLVTFMMKEANYKKWSDKCIKCAAPTEYALKGTLCEGTTCTVRRKYLGQSAKYYIYVGFKDDVSNPYNDRSFADSTSPRSVKSANTKEAVSISVWPKWKLQGVTSKARYAAYGKKEDRAWIADAGGRGVFSLGS